MALWITIVFYHYFAAFTSMMDWRWKRWDTVSVLHIACSCVFPQSHLRYYCHVHVTTIIPRSVPILASDSQVIIITTLRSQWWRVYGDTDRSSLQYCRVSLYFCDDLGKIDWYIFCLTCRDILGYKFVSFFCFHGSGNSSTLGTAILRLAFDHALWCRIRIFPVSSDPFY